MRDGIGAFDSKHTSIAKTFTSDFPTSAANAAKKTLDTEEIALWILPRQFDEKRTVAASEIDREWSSERKNRSEIKRLEIILRHVLDRKCRRNFLHCSHPSTYRAEVMLEKKRSANV